MSDGDEPEKLTGFVGTGAGSTWMELELFTTRAVLHFHSQWMGDKQPLDVMFTLRRSVLGSHSGALVVETAQVSEHSKTLPLPPSDGPLVLEYARLPPQGAGSDVWSLLLWLRADVYYDDGTQLAPQDYDCPPEDFAPVVKVLGELERPWKFGATHDAE